MAFFSHVKLWVSTNMVHYVLFYSSYSPTDNSRCLFPVVSICSLTHTWRHDAKRKVNDDVHVRANLYMSQKCSGARYKGVFLVSNLASGLSFYQNNLRYMYMHIAKCCTSLTTKLSQRQGISTCILSPCLAVAPRLGGNSSGSQRCHMECYIQD